jgi:eukaryotic-like serine/threonine-protein kinase
MTARDQTFVVGPYDAPDTYRLRRQVGNGGEAVLWEADVDLSGERERVAVKILHEHHGLDLARWQERWAEQARLLKLASHPAVVGVHEHFAGPAMHRPGAADPASRALYLVMNWVEGQNLGEWVVRNRRPEDRLEGLRYLTQVAGVLDWLHSGRVASSGRPVVHGDISPGNVVVNRDGQAVLVDFGLVKIDRHVTTTPTGTPGYRAPELLRHGEYTPASDRYAFGALAYYVLSGENPPEDPQALAAGLGRLPESVPVAASAELGRIVAENPDDRPPAGEWMRQLRLHSSTASVVAGGLPPLAPRTSSPRAEPTTVPSRPAAITGGVHLSRPVIVGGAAVALVVLVALVAALLRTPGGGSGPVAAPASSPTVSRAPATTAPASPAFTPTYPPTSVTTPTSRPPARTVSVVKLQPETSELLQGTWKLDGVAYQQSLACEDCVTGKSATYDLAGGYRTFAATLATSSNFGAELVVELDSREPVHRNATAGHPVDLEVDVSGAQTMTVELTGLTTVVVGRAELRT